jgi:hypothetical protein
MTMTNPFPRLAAQACTGTEQAADRLRDELCPRLEWLVSRTLLLGQDTTPLSKHVQREARLLHEGEAIPLDSESMVERIVDRLWQGILSQLRAGRQGGLRDTWRSLGQTLVTQ